ncbi:MAG TPA: DUF2461 domain-containing protein [Longimicrobiales bacterium]|nr:DUF2461 domain-containing protein [Longimicrobiales bacterium]
MATTAHFGPGLFEFLAELKENNDRAWFEANKRRYAEAVQEPMLRFIGDLGGALERIAPEFVANPRRVGGSMFRIHRDTRFSKDKSPYKTAAAAHFRHSAAPKGVSAPGFYLHLEPGSCFGGGGIYHPDPGSLRRVRDRIAAEPEEWREVRRMKLPIQGEALKRAPAGYDPAHPFIEDLKLKDLYAMASFTEREVCAPDFLERYAAVCATTAPLLRFVSRALELPW